MTGTITRAKLTRADLALWNGTTASYTRADASGGTVSGLAIGEAVDVLQVYGAGTSQSNTTVASAIAALGSRNVAIVFAPGTWAIEDNVTVPSNLVSHIPPGCVFDVSSGKTLTFNGPVVQEASSPSTGLGTVVGLNVESAIKGAFYGKTTDETTAGVTVKDWGFPPGNVRRYGAKGDNSTDDTTAIQAAINAMSVDTANGGCVYIPVGDYLVDTLTIDARGLNIRGEGKNSRLIASSDIPASGAILLSLAGGSDAAVNNALLDGIYGASVHTGRTSITGSLEEVHIDDIQFVSNSVACRGVWMTGFTRGCRIMGCYFSNFDGAGIVLNGSWSFSLINNHISGDGTNGTGIQLGMTGKGERSGTIVVNAPCIIGNECTGHSNGMTWDFGSGGLVAGNTFEGNVNDGFQSQSVTGIAFVGNYLELNLGDNLQMGGTNGSDFAEGWIVSGNYFLNNTGNGNNIRINGAQRCKIGHNQFSGTQAAWYFIAAGIGQYITDCDIEVAEFNSTYIDNFSTEANAAYNEWHNAKRQRFYVTVNGNHTFTIQDPARVVYKASGGAGETWTIDSNANVPMPTGAVLKGVNRGGGTLTIAITSDTIQLAGGTSTGNRTVADGGEFTIEKVDTTVWMIRGQGVT